MNRRIDTLSLMIDDFVSVKSTNEQKRFTEQMLKMSSSLYLQPITVIKVSKIPNYSKLTLYDVSSGELVTDNKKKMNAWLVIDGTKRLKAMMQCYHSTADNSYLTVDAVVEHIDNIPHKDIIQYLIDIDYMINQPEKKDFVDLAYTKCLDNPII